MSRITQLVDVLLADPSRPRVSPNWSLGRVQTLRDMANQAITLRSPIDDKIAATVLLCVEGHFAHAKTEVVRLMRDNFDLIREDRETFISVIFALYVLQEFSLLAAMLHDRFGFNGEFSIDVEDNGPGLGRIRWEISAEGMHRFVFDAKSYAYDKTRDDILAFYWAFPMYANFSFSKHVEPGAIIINQMDIGGTPGLAWSDNRPDYFLVPDCIFIPTRGYDWARQVLTQNLLPWQERKGVAFWRGGTTGIPRVSDDWRTLERVALCEIARRHEHLGFLDVGLSAVLQIADPASIEAIANSGLMRDFVPWEQWGQFKYQIDIDDNSSPWSNLFQRLLTGSTVLKVESSRALNQWYYDKLKPWVNYVPVAPDMSDLIDKIQWLRTNDGFAKAIGEAGRALAMSLTYEQELEQSAHTIARCFRYFRGDTRATGPFGREWVCS